MGIVIAGSRKADGGESRVGLACSRIRRWKALRARPSVDLDGSDEEGPRWAARAPVNSGELVSRDRRRQKLAIPAAHAVDNTAERWQWVKTPRRSPPSDANHARGSERNGGWKLGPRRQPRVYSGPSRTRRGLLIDPFARDGAGGRGEEPRTRVGRRCGCSCREPVAEVGEKHLPYDGGRRSRDRRMKSAVAGYGGPR